MTCKIKTLTNWLSMAECMLITKECKCTKNMQIECKDVMYMHLTLKHTKTEHARSLDARLMTWLMRHVKEENKNAMRMNDKWVECKGVMHMHSISMHAKNWLCKGLKCNTNMKCIM